MRSRVMDSTSRLSDSPSCVPSLTSPTAPPTTFRKPQSPTSEQSPDNLSMTLSVFSSTKVSFDASNPSAHQLSTRTVSETIITISSAETVAVSSTSTAQLGTVRVSKHPTCTDLTSTRQKSPIGAVAPTASGHPATKQRFLSDRFGSCPAIGSVHKQSRQQQEKQ